MYGTVSSGTARHMNGSLMERKSTKVDIVGRKQRHLGSQRKVEEMLLDRHFCFSRSANWLPGNLSHEATYITNANLIG